jgi:ribokinase
VTRVVVVGYASLDHALQLGEFHGPDATSLVTGRLSAEWPRAGGVAHHVRALRAARPDVTVRAVSWVGPDDGGAGWRRAVRATGADDAGVHVTGTRTPSAYLMYVADGGTVCVFDPADCHPQGGGLTAEQRAVVAGADWCLLAVAPQRATHEVLDALPATARLVWAVKHDDDAYPPDLVELLLARAEVVSLSAGERAFLSPSGTGTAGPDPDGPAGPADLTGLAERAGAGTLLVETRGAAGVHARLGTGTREVAVTPVHAVDTTGAGDTFVAALTAGLLDLPRPLTLTLAEPALADAARAAGDLIASRGAGQHAPAPHHAPTKE